MGLARSTVWFALGNGVAFGLPVLLLPWLTRVLSAEDYGVLSLFMAAFTLLGPLVSVNLNAAVGRQYYERKALDFAGYVGTCLALSTLTALGIGLIVAVFATPLSGLMKVPHPWLLVAVSAAYFQSVSNLYLAILQASERANTFAMVQTAQGLCVFALTFVIGESRGYSWRSVALAQFGGISIVAVASLSLLVREGWLSWRFDRIHARHAVGYGGPLIPHAVAGYVLVVADKIILANLVGVEASGLYEVGMQVSSGMRLATMSLNQAWSPRLYAVLANGDDSAKRRMVRFTYASFLGMGALVLMLTVLAHSLIPWLLGSQFGGSTSFVFWLCLGFAFNGMYLLVTNYVFYVGKTHLLALSTGFTGVLNIALNFALISVNGPIGAAQASAFGFLCLFLLTWFLSARLYPMPWLCVAQSQR